MTIEAHIVKDLTLLRENCHFLELVYGSKSVEVTQEMNEAALLTTRQNLIHGFTEFHEVLNNQLSSLIFQNFVNGRLQIREPLQREFMKFS